MHGIDASHRSLLRTRETRRKSPKLVIQSVFDHVYGKISEYRRIETAEMGAWGILSAEEEVGV